jgi:hypothetical protein
MVDMQTRLFSPFWILPRLIGSALLVLFSWSPNALAQMSPTEAQDLVRKASQNETAKVLNGQPFRFLLRKIDEKGDITKEIVQTKEGDIARLVLYNNQPLTDERKEQERARLDHLMAHPEEQQRRHRREQEDSARADKLVTLLPDAFIYEYIGTVPGASGPVIKLHFKPNPQFSPPDREAEVYHGMAGELWIDEAQVRMVRLDAHLIADVNFGWGFLGRLYKGGSIVVEQADVGYHHWETTHMKLSLTGRALMVKSLNIHTQEDESDFHPVPKDIGYQDAIRMLEAPPAPAQASAQR